MSTPRLTLSDLTTAQTRTGMARFAPNWLPVVVLEFHPPEEIDGTAFPASVTVQSLLEYVRVVTSPEDGGSPLRLNEGERILTGPDGQAFTGTGDTSARYTAIARPYDPVRIVFNCAGSSELALISDPRPGDMGMLILAGRSIADAMAAQANAANPATVLPEYMPNPLRLSDGFYMGFVLGGAAAVPDEAKPVQGTAQLGPRDARASSVYLRLAGQAWTLAGQSIKIGANANKGAARLDDPVLPDPDWTAWLTASMTTIGGALIPPVVIPPQPAFGGKITGASGTVTIQD